jgi:hypothetical protein
VNVSYPSLFESNLFINNYASLSVNFIPNLLNANFIFFISRLLPLAGSGVNKAYAYTGLKCLFLDINYSLNSSNYDSNFNY